MEFIDHYYREPLKKITPFSFNEEVATVFDDMVRRSVPFYDEIHKILCDLLNYHYQKNDIIYDLGHSTGTTIKILNNFLDDKSGQFIGVDNSKAMIKKSREKLGHLSNVQIIEDDISNIEFKECGIVIMNYTLQFIPVKKRETLLKKIYQALRPGGIFILSEKIESNSKVIQNLLTDLYYDFKRRNGYSELEISQKREALENVLIPLTPTEQLKMLQKSGFKEPEMIFRWYNFSSFIGIKELCH